MWPHQKRWVETLFSAEFEVKHSFLVVYGRHVPPTPPHPTHTHTLHRVTASMLSVMWRGSQSPYVGACRDKHFLSEGLPRLMGLGTETLTQLPCWEVFSQQKPPPSSAAHSGCHHLSMARRHSLSQQMRGLSERAPQFLRGSGEGRSRLKALVSSNCIAICTSQAVTSSATWPWGGKKKVTSALRGEFLWSHFCRHYVLDVWLGQCRRSLRCLAQQNIIIYL